MKRGFVWGVVTTIIAANLVFTGCKKKQPEQMMAPQQQASQMGVPQKIETVLIVPDEVKKKWKAIKLNLTDKATNKSTLVTAEIGKETPLPGTNLKVFVEAFLPAFKMDGGQITSTSADQTTNPAAKVIITEDGQEIFKGWLFELYPTVHPFNHPKYTLSLAGYERK